MSHRARLSPLVAHNSQSEERVQKQVSITIPPNSLCQTKLNLNHSHTTSTKKSSTAVWKRPCTLQASLQQQEAHVGQYVVEHGAWRNPESSMGTKQCLFSPLTFPHPSAGQTKYLVGYWPSEGKQAGCWITSYLRVEWEQRWCWHGCIRQKEAFITVYNYDFHYQSGSEGVERNCHNIFRMFHHE